MSKKLSTVKGLINNYSMKQIALRFFHFDVGSKLYSNILQTLNQSIPDEVNKYRSDDDHNGIYFIYDNLDDFIVFLSKLNANLLNIIKESDVDVDVCIQMDTFILPIDKNLIKKCADLDISIYIQYLGEKS